MSARHPAQRLNGFDAVFFHTGAPAVHQQITLTYVLGPHTSLTYEKVVAGLLDRLDRLPPLRRRTFHVPFSLHHPVWVALPDIDPEHHFHRVTVGGTGTRRDLDDVTATIASTPLDDYEHPLWELHYVDGLEDGQVAVIIKIHHSLADGAVATTLIENIADLAADAAPARVEQKPSAAELPRRRHLIPHALRDIVLGLIGLPALIVRTVRGMFAVAAYKRKHQAKVPTPMLSSPRVSFNKTLTPRRKIATTDILMSDIKAIRVQHEGATVNDVLLGVVSGIMRRWLAEHDEHPRSTLIAGIPVGMDKPDAERRLLGNALSNLTTTLATDIDDPTERLLAISTSMRHVKELDRLRGPENLQAWLSVVPGGLISVTGRLMTALRLPDVAPPPFTLQVSNTPGPRTPILIGSAPLRAIRTTGPLLQGNGLGIIGYSYTDRMNVTIFSCPDLFDDVDQLLAWIPDALADYDLGA